MFRVVLQFLYYLFESIRPEYPARETQQSVRMGVRSCVCVLVFVFIRVHACA